jgi:hypothetical protein
VSAPDFTNNPREMLELYLDGMLDESQRAAFERAMAGDADLRREVELAGRVEASLRTSFARERIGLDSPAGNVRASERPGVAGFVGPRGMPAARFGVAAAILLALGAGVYFAGRAFGPGSGTPAPGANGTQAADTAASKRPPDHLERTYARRVADGFKPDEVCTDTVAFRGWMKKAFGQELEPGEHEGSVMMVGWSYAPVISDYAGVLLARVDGKEVLTFIDTIENDRKWGGARFNDSRGLRTFRREIGKLVLYETTPIDHPTIVNTLRIPGSG